MKQFIVKIAVFFFILVCIGVLVDTFVFPKNINPMRLKYNLLEKHKEAEVLVLGNSHTFFGLNPEASDFAIINVANKGRKIETDYFILKAHIDKLKNVKFVIMPVSHCKMHAVALNEQEKRLYYNYYELKEYKQNIIQNSLILNEPFRELMNDAVFKNTKLSALGWRASSATYIRDTMAIKERIEMSEDTDYIEGKVHCDNSYLEQMNELCKQYGKKLVLLIPPYHPDFYEFSDPEYQKNSTTQLRTLAKEKGMVFIEGRQLRITDNRYYENSDHLNVHGAKVFTKKIDSILKLSL